MRDCQQIFKRVRLSAESVPRDKRLVFCGLLTTLADESLFNQKKANLVSLKVTVSAGAEK